MLLSRRRRAHQAALLEQTAEQLDEFNEVHAAALLRSLAAQALAG